MCAMVESNLGQRPPGSVRMNDPETESTMNAQPTRMQDLLEDPRYMIYDTHPVDQTTRFLVADEALQADAPFLDIRFEPNASRGLAVSTPKLLAAERRLLIKRRPLHFIFHHAFVCSTLLARSLHESDAFFSLKEPWILRRMADIKRTQRKTLSKAQWRHSMALYLSLLSKTHANSHTTIVKATNIANNLLEDIVEDDPDRRAIYLYSSIEDFLISNIKKPRATQLKMPELLNGFLRDSNFLAKHKQFNDISKLSLFEVCGLIWVVNAYNLRHALNKTHFEGMRTLAVDHLLGAPIEAIHAVSCHFGVVPSEDQLTAMLCSNIWNRNAKDTSHSYSTAQRTSERDQVMSTHGSEIEAATSWAEQLASELKLPGFLTSLSVHG